MYHTPKLDKRVKTESIGFPKVDRWSLQLLTPLNIPSFLRLYRQSSSPQEKTPRTGCCKHWQFKWIEGQQGGHGNFTAGGQLVRRVSDIWALEKVAREVHDHLLRHLRCWRSATMVLHQGLFREVCLAFHREHNEWIQWLVQAYSLSHICSVLDDPDLPKQFPCFIQAEVSQSMRVRKGKEQSTAIPQLLSFLSASVGVKVDGSITWPKVSGLAGHIRFSMFQKLLPLQASLGSLEIPYLQWWFSTSLPTSLQTDFTLSSLWIVLRAH